MDTEGLVVRFYQSISMGLYVSTIQKH